MYNNEITKHIMALKHWASDVRWQAAYRLGEIGDASAVSPLGEALNDESVGVRESAAYALGKIGDVSALPALLLALKDKEDRVRLNVADALRKTGDADTLPRKILAGKRFSAQEKMDLLEKLRRTRYSDFQTTLRYKFPETGVLCQLLLDDDDAEVREGAQAVFNRLDGKSLLRASQCDSTADGSELLRATQTSLPETQPDTLLRAADESEQKAEPPDRRNSLWKRLFG